MGPHASRRPNQLDRLYPRGLTSTNLHPRASPTGEAGGGDQEKPGDQVSVLQREKWKSLNPPQRV